MWRIRGGSLREEPAIPEAGRTPLSMKCILMLALLSLGLLSSASAQSEQQIVVTIHNYAFETTQMPLQLHVPTVIHLRNQDDVRHDFGSDIFQNSYTRVESADAVTYGDSIGGVFVEPGADVDIRFTIEREGRYSFQCSIHPDMKGEIILLTVEAV